MRGSTERRGPWVAMVLVLVLALSACGKTAPTQDGNAGGSQPAPAAGSSSESPSPAPATPEPAAADVVIQFETTPDADLTPQDAADSKTMVDTSQYKKAGPYKIGFSNASISNSWRVFMLQHVKWQASRYPEIAELFVTDGQDNAAKQIADTEDLLAKGIDALIISPATADALNPVIEKATAAGVPVIVVDRRASTSQYVTFVESSNHAYGAKMARWLVEKLGGKGNVILLKGYPGAGVSEDRLAGALSVLTQYPDIQIVGESWTKYSRAEGKKATEDFIQANPQIDGVWADSGIMSAGAIEAFLEAGKPVPPVTGEDFNGYFKLAQQHKLDTYGVTFPSWMGAVAVDMAIKTLHGEPVPKYVSLKGKEITLSNIGDLVRPDMPDDFWVDNMLPNDWLPK